MVQWAAPARLFAKESMNQDELLRYGIDLFDESVERFEPVHTQMGEELAFNLSLEHYRDDEGPNKSPERVQPRGRELKQHTNHILAQVSKAHFYLDVRPVDSDQVNAERAEVLKGAIESELYHPAKDFLGCRERAVLQSVAARMGYLAIEYDAGVGPWGEILYRTGDGRRLIWADGYASPHDPRCPWVLEILMPAISEVEGKKGWKNTDGLVPDADYLYEPQAFRTSNRKPENLDPARGRIVVCKLWERNVKDTRQVERRLTPLSPEKRFMKCDCGVQGQTQAQVGFPLPETDMCPACQNEATRQDAVLETDVQLANRKGKRLTIFAPLQTKLFVTLNQWPEDLPTVPYAVYKWEDHPTEPYGVSLTYEHWTMQLASDMVTRLGLEHMILAKPYTIQQRGALQDYSGQEFAFDPAQGLNMYYESALPADRVLHMAQAGGLPPAWSALDQSIQGRFNAHTGTSDLGLTAANSKDIAASTVTQYIEQGELPVQHLITRIRRSDTVAVQIINHLIHKTWTTARWVEYQGADGERRAMLMSGDDLAGYNVVVTAEPEIARLDAEELNAWTQFLSLGSAGQEFVGKRLGIPISEIRRLGQQQQLQAQQQAQQVAQQADAASQRRMQEKSAPAVPGNGIAARMRGGG